MALVHRRPVVQPREYREHHAADQHIVQVRHDEVRVVHLPVEWQHGHHHAREAAQHEDEVKAQQEQGGRVDLHAPLPERGDLSDSELWDVVAFVQRLPDLNAAQYKEWIARAAGAPACGRELSAAGTTVTASTPPDVKRGHEALSQCACNACHIIPGVTGSNVHVGPSLDGIGSRTLIAGTLANTPENLARWLRETQKVKPGTAMPQLGVVEEDARDIAAFLGTLR